MEKLDFRVLSKGGTEIEVIQEIPSKLRKFAPVVYENHLSAADFGNMIYNVFRGNGFTIWFSVYHIFKNAFIKGWGDTPILELHIPLNDEFVSKFDGIKQYALKTNQYDLSYFPHVNNEVELRGGMHSRTFDTHFTLAYLKKFYGISTRFDNFLAAVENGREPVSLVNTTQFLSTDMIRLINSMIHFDLRDEVAPFYFDGAILQLTSFVIERLAGIDSALPKIFSATIKDRTIAAKEIMLSNLETRYTTAELAKKVLLSECSLQDCFKYLYGDTIFHYGQAVRMEKAGDLLIIKKDLTIQDIAEEVGYKNNSNFTNAFKKQFGCTPEYHRRHGKLSKPE